MKKKAQQQDSAQIIDELAQIPGEVANAPLDTPADVQDDKAKKVQFMESLRKPVGDIGNTANSTGIIIDQIEKNLRNMPESSGMPTRMYSSYFNLLKSAQLTSVPQAPTMQGLSAPNMGSPGSGPSPSPTNQVSQMKFSGPEDVRNYLDKTEYDEARQGFISLFSGDEMSQDEFQTDPTGAKPSNTQENVASLIKSFFENMNDDGMKNDIALKLYDLLPQGQKTQNNQIPGKDQFVVTPKAASNLISRIVQETNDIIQKTAQRLADRNKNEKKSFNLKKTAQHKALDNVMMFGPSQTRVDPFTGQMISNWHVLERNKGFGGSIDDVLDIDWETIWRGTVMDKYSRPYRNDKGEWVGGYINKRFEVDHSTPIGNNYQLLPGQKRRPYLPEYGILEARMEAARTESNKKRGYAPSSDGKPFNWKDWKMSQSKKKVAT